MVGVLLAAFECQASCSTEHCDAAFRVATPDQAV